MENIVSPTLIPMVSSRIFILRGYRLLSISIPIRPLQSLESLTCEAYAIFVMYNITLHGVENIIQILGRYLSNDFRYNDEKIIGFLFWHFKMLRCERLFCNRSMSKAECRRLYCTVR